MRETKKDWIVSTKYYESNYSTPTNTTHRYTKFKRCNSKTVSEMKQELVRITTGTTSVITNDIYYSGTEKVEDVTETEISNFPKEHELSAYANFDEFYFEFTAIPLTVIENCEENKNV